jgi:hypothetical protein
MSKLTSLLEAAAAGDRHAAADLPPSSTTNCGSLRRGRAAAAEGYEGLKQCEKTIPPEGSTRIPEALDRFIDLYTATNELEEVKRWQAERSKYPNVSPPLRESDDRRRFRTAFSGPRKRHPYSAWSPRENVPKNPLPLGLTDRRSDAMCRSRMRCDQPT